jgi:signal-transduction protein with cAMP-binding, CBS, and nucleotidyltransferase domain
VNSTFVKDIMSKNVLTVEKSTTLQEAAQQMKESSIGCVIVMDDSKPIGIVTERDFVTKIVADGRPLFTEIYEVASSPLITIKPGETVWEASETMKEKGIHKLPVMDNDQITGIVTTTL